jgi:hypothetical protein
MYKMKKTAFILGAAMVGVQGQAYSDTLADYALNDLASILAAYDVGDYSTGTDYDFNESTQDISAVDSAAYSGAEESEYEEVGPADVEFGDYPSGFDDQYFDGDNTEDISASDFTDERLRPNKLEFEFDSSGNIIGSGALTKLSQPGTGSHTGTDFNNCRICHGETASACLASATVETCNDAQPVCQITVRIARKGAEPQFWSECKEKKSCYNDEEQNFRANDRRFNQCKSTSMSARFFHASQCTFCMKMGTGTDQLLFRDTSGSDNALKILTSDGTTEINVADALAAPEDYFANGAGNYIYDSQTWYTEAMGSP